MTRFDHHREKKRDRDLHRDPFTGAPGAHPVETALGAVGGGLAGAAAGSLAGPIGVALGVVAGAVAGGLLGKDSGEHMHPTGEAAYWQRLYRNEPYYTSIYTFDDYAPAFRAGYERRMSHRDEDWDRAQSLLEAAWNSISGKSPIPWEHARHAVDAAWHKADRSVSNAAAEGDAAL